MGARSLRQMAQKVCVHNISAIEDVGDAEYDIIRPLLLVCSPHQLDKFEKQSPQLIGRDAEIWRAFIQRDIELWKTQFEEPQDPRNFAKIYRKLAKAQRLRMIEDEARLKNTMQGIKSAKAANTTRKVELDIVKPPPGVVAESEIIRASPAIRRALQIRRRTSKADTADKVKPSSKLAGFRKQAAAMSRFAKPAHGQVVTRPMIPKMANSMERKIEKPREAVAILPSHRTATTPPQQRKRPAAQAGPHRGDNDSEPTTKRFKTGDNTISQAPTPSPRPSPSPASISARNMSSGSAGHSRAGDLSDRSSPSTHHNTPKPGLPSSPTLQSTKAETTVPPKPAILKKKRPVSIFMPPKKARVH